MIDLTQSFVTLIKILVLVLEILYVVFAFILSKQVKLMNNSFTTDLAVLFQTIALLHLLAAIILLALSALALF